MPSNDGPGATGVGAPHAVALPESVEEVVARYDDLEHDALVADVALYCELARRAGGTVLELGCGTGRVLAGLVRAGHQVVGVDRSAPALARAAARLTASGVAQGRWRLEVADARALALGERAALVLAPLDFLGYCLTRHDQLAVLAGARAHLWPQGQLAIDVPFPPGAIVGQPEGVLVHQWTHEGADGARVTKWWAREIDAARQVQQLTGYYDVAAPDGTLRRWVHELTLRYYFRYELELLLGLAGFEVDGVYGTYALDELTGDSLRLLVLAHPDPAGG